VNQVAEKIAREIVSRGHIPFARFMELALYCPDYGYYEKEEDTIGRSGDYYTSVSVGSLFGQLLALQFADWTQDEPSRVRVVEAGAHGGQLARDILNWLRKWRPSLFERVEYCLVEPSPRRREWQSRTLGEFGGQVRWVARMSELAGSQFAAAVHGVIFANELLDALPVHRLVWEAHQRRWLEMGVTLIEGRFEWTRLEGQELPGSACPLPTPLTHFLPHPEAELAEALPDGFIFDYCPAAAAWWREAASVLAHGRLVTLDYSLSDGVLLSPERGAGTLRAYFRHQVSSDLFAHPGCQDLTAHVDFASLQAVGEAAGLKTEAMESQARFLTRIAARIWQADLGFDAWTPKQNRQFLTLTHPEHLGGRFRVLIQRANGGSLEARIRG
jgi:SAM-dependent MidA family methyltransferase